MNRFQQSVLRFIRNHRVSAAELFLMWRHYPDQATCASIPELARIPTAAFRKLPSPPAPSGLFSIDEIGVIRRLADVSAVAHDPLRFKGWGLINRCVWERLFPESFPHRVASKLLREANDADDLPGWVDNVLKPQHEYYERCLDLLIVDVSRITVDTNFSEVEFNEFLAANKSKTAPKGLKP